MECISTKTIFLLCCMLFSVLADTFQVALTCKNHIGKDHVTMQTLKKGQIRIVGGQTKILELRKIYAIRFVKLNSKNKRVELSYETTTDGEDMEQGKFYIKHKQYQGLEFVKWLSKSWKAGEIKTNSTFVQGFEKYFDNALDLDMNKMTNQMTNIRRLKVSLDYNNKQNNELKTLEVVMLKTEDSKRNFRKGFAPQDKTIITSISKPQHYYDNNNKVGIKVAFKTKSGEEIVKTIFVYETKSKYTPAVDNFLKAVYKFKPSIFKNWDVRSLRAYELPVEEAMTGAGIAKLRRQQS